MSRRYTPNPAIEAARRITRQADLYSDVLYQLVRDVFASGKPADRVIGAFFKRQKRFGSHDRRFLNETYFAIFRWWGWLRYLPDGRTEFVFPAKSTDAAGSSRDDEEEGDAPNVWNQVKDREEDEDYGDDDDDVEDARPVRVPAGEVGTDCPNVEAWLCILLGAHILDTDDLHPIAAEWKRQVLGRRGALDAFVDCVGSADMETHRAAIRRAFPKARTELNLLMPQWVREELPPPVPDDLAEVLQQRPPMWLRAQRGTSGRKLAKLLTGDGIAAEVGTMPGGVSISQTRVNLYSLQSFKDGLFEVQDAASQCIGRACMATPGQRWWDACAGAGGKSLQLADIMENKGTVVATDIREWKLADLKKRARRAGFSNIHPKPWDGKKARPDSFDGVLVDAPCSCTGTWRRSPDAKWTSGLHDPKEMHVLQLQILAKAAPAVRPGGTLVYATCSLCKSENEDVVTEFLKTTDQFELEAFPHPATGIPVTGGCLRVWPGQLNSDAVFIARFRRKKG